MASERVSSTARQTEGHCSCRLFSFVEPPPARFNSGNDGGGRVEKGVGEGGEEE